jgi:hypothetical protein
MKDISTFLDGIYEDQTHYFHLTSVARLSRCPGDRTIVFFTNTSFIVVGTTALENHTLNANWARYAIPIPIPIPM